LMVRAAACPAPSTQPVLSMTNFGFGPPSTPRKTGRQSLL
jgi:hypothetical protein